MNSLKSVWRSIGKGADAQQAEALQRLQPFTRGAMPPELPAIGGICGSESGILDMETVKRHGQGEA